MLRLKKRALIMLCIVFSTVMGGCGGTELENKNFPLAVLVEAQDHQYRICYLAQNLSQVSNERSDGDNMTAASATGSTYYETQKAFEKNNRCQLDMSHTKVVVFHKNFIKNGELDLFLDTVRSENTFARNTLVYFMDSSMEKMAELNSGLEIPFGSYLEQMTENEQDIHEKAVVTLGSLLNEQANAGRILLIPVLKAENGMPAVYEYEVLCNFREAGRIDTKAAQVYYLLANQLQQMDLHLKADEQVHLNNISCSRDFILTGKKVTQQLTLKAEARRITGSAGQKEIEQMLQTTVDEVCRTGMEDLQIDLSDSYQYLPMYAPEIYQIYQNRPEEYLYNLGYQIQVQIRIV